jgi:chemotaxis protein MotB
MPLASRRSRRSSIDIWPGFVDALAQLLMVIIFMLLVFTAGQFLLSDALSGRDKALQELQQQVSELSSLLALERSAAENLRAEATAVSSRLQATLAERDAAQAQLAELAAKSKEQADQAAQVSGQLSEATAQLGSLRERAEQAEKTLSAEQQKSAAARAQVEQLTAAVAALREQLAKIAAALDVSEAKVKEQQTHIADLGKRLNLALATKVQELARYRSEFFGKLREIIGERPDIRIVGDRFVFQSEVLYSPGSAELGDAAKYQLDPVIAALKAISDKIPKELNWVLRVDGHTDKRPISNAQFPSNWELSAARAISVVQYMIAQDVPANRLAAAGFADNQPLDTAEGEEAYRRNRRIELKLTER